MVRATCLVAAIALASLVPWDEAQAVRVQRRRDPPGSSSSARSERVVRWRDTTRAGRRPAGAAPGAGGPGEARSRGPIGIVHGRGGTERVLGGREAEGGVRVGVQIDRTRRMLDLVRARAERCGSAEARDAVRRAAELQDRAESAARAGRQLGALQLTRGAREQGIAALRHCGHTGRSPEGVVSALGRTDELLGAERERLSERSFASPGGRSEALERAAAAQRQAHAEFRDGRLESSLRLTQEARQSLRQGARREAGAGRSGAPRPGAMRPRQKRD